MAALHFAESGVDLGVVEVGVGGRLSPTNVLAPLVAVLTNVSLDDTGFLGPTEADIAREKAQIIKPEGAVASAVTQPAVVEIVRERAHETGSTLWLVGRDVSSELATHDVHGETLTVRTPVRDHTNLVVPLLGMHQAVNAATAVSAADLLTTLGIPVPDEAVHDGLAGVAFPGRFEIVSSDPLVILDGARNVASAHALRETLDDLFPGRPVILLIGVLGDKDAHGIVEELAPGAKSAIVTTPPWEGRVGDLSRLQSALNEHILDVRFIPEAEVALRAALEAQTGDDIVLVTGSLYLVAAIRHQLLQERHIWSTPVVLHPSKGVRA